MCSTLPNPTTTITPFQKLPQGNPNYGSVPDPGNLPLKFTASSLTKELAYQLNTADSTCSNQSSMIGVSIAGDEEPCPQQSSTSIIADFARRIHFAQGLAKQGFPVDSVPVFAFFLQDCISLLDNEIVLSQLKNHSSDDEAGNASSKNFSQLEKILNGHIDRAVLQGMASLLGCSIRDLLKHEMYQKLGGYLVLMAKNESPEKILETVLDCVKENHDQNTSIVFNQLKEFDSHCSHFFRLNNAEQGDIAAFKKTYPIFRKKIFDCRCEIFAFQQSFVTAARKGCFVDAGAASKAIDEKIKLMKQNLGQLKQAGQRANHEHRVYLWRGVVSQLPAHEKSPETSGDDSFLCGLSEEGDDRYSLSELSVATESTQAEERNPLHNPAPAQKASFAQKLAVCCGTLKTELSGRISVLISRIASFLGRFFHDYFANMFTLPFSPPVNFQNTQTNASRS